MPDEEGAVYYVGNIGTHRHAAGSWDRACENPIIKVKDGRINWVIGQHDALVRHEADMNTVTGVAGIVDDILIAHIVEPARYIAFTTDGFTLGNVIVDETGRQPRVGSNAIYIESFTGLFLRDPESGKRLLFAVSSGDDRILEVTGPGDLTRVEGEIILPSSFPREPAPVGQAVIPYETWWGSNARGYSIDANDWQWLPRSAGLSIYEDNAIVGDVRMRRDAGALHILANTIAPYPRQPDFTPQAPSDLWGNWTGVELLIGPARPVNGRRPMPGDTRIFLAVHDGKGVALAHRTDTPGWEAIPGAQVAVRRRWHGYGWRLEAEIPFEALPEVTRERLQVFRRGVQIQTHQEERLDFAGPVRLNAALHIYDGTKVRRVPWVDDGTRLDQPGQMQPDRWGYANAMVELSWQESFDAEEFSIYRASVEQPHAVTRVAEKVWGTSHIDTPEPGDYLYWLAPVTHEGEGQPFGPVASQESAAGFPSVKEVAAYQFDEIGDIVIRKPHNVGLANIAVQAQAVSASSPPGIRTSATKNGHENWIVSVMAPANSQIGSVYTIRLRATGADGNVSESSFDAVVGVDMMAGLPLGSMAPGKEGATGWIRSPQTNAATGSPIHVVTVTNTDGIPAPSIEMRAWNVNNLITYRLNSKPTQSYWEASGHIRVITRAGGTTIGITMLDANDSSIANLEFGRGRVGAETTEYISLQGEYVATAADYRISGTWQPFTIRAENGIIRMTYGSGNRSYTIEKEALRGSTWNEPGALRVYLGGQSSGRHANVDNLFFISK